MRRSCMSLSPAGLTWCCYRRDFVPIHPVIDTCLVAGLTLCRHCFVLLQRFMAQYGFVPAGGNVADRVGFEVPDRWVPA